MNIYVIAHLIITFMCLVSYLMYGVTGRTEVTLFRILLVLGVGLVPIVNVFYTLWCVIYIIYEIFMDFKNKILEINKKAFPHELFMSTKSC